MQISIFLTLGKIPQLFCFSIFFHKNFSAIRTRSENHESGGKVTIDQNFGSIPQIFEKNIFWKFRKVLKMCVFRVLLYNLMVWWHDIKHKLHVLVTLHVTNVIKMITGVMQPTYNPILVWILNKFWFCAKPLAHVGNSPLRVRK